MSTNAKLFQCLRFVAVVNGLLIGADSDSCVNDADHSGLSRRSLLQVWNRSSGFTTGLSFQSSFPASASGVELPTKQFARRREAKSALPPKLYELGLEIMGSEELLDDVVANTATAEVPYGGVQMSFRMVNGDGVDSEDVYGVDSLDQLLDRNGMMNMLDIGGNYGRVSMAAFLRNRKKMRIIVVEPAPSTYFLLKWNLFLNDIPDLTKDEFLSGTIPGVYALNNGIGSREGEAAGLCYTPPFTMMARMCDCEEIQADGSQCSTMVGRTIDTLFDMFGSEPLSFVKMDCEGCEINAMPAIARLAKAGRRVGRFGGELHAKGNELEDMACKFQNGKWVVHVCWEAKSKKYDLASVEDRCHDGPSRKSCSDEGAK